MKLIKTFRDVKKLKRTKHLLTTPADGYARPRLGFDSTTTVWRVDEIIKKDTRDWMNMFHEDGYSGKRESVARKDLTIYTGTYSVFPAPVVERIMIRFCGEKGKVILDAFSGGPPRGIIAGVMGYEYHGFDINKEQIKTNKKAVKNYFRNNPHKVFFHVGDAKDVDKSGRMYDFAFTCPPYWNVEVYSDDPNDLSTLPTYTEFDAAMFQVIQAHYPVMKPGSFAAMIVGNFRDKKGALIDFRGDTVSNYMESGFIFHQEVILSKNFGSAAKRAGNAWKGKKLIPIHEHLLIFKKPENKTKTKRVRL